MGTDEHVALARVIPLQQLRRTRRTRRASTVKTSGTRAIVALWFGTLLVGAASLVAALTTVALRAGTPGTLGLIVAGAAIAWPLAGRWMQGWRPSFRARERAPRRSA